MGFSGGWSGERKLGVSGGGGEGRGRRRARN